MLFVHAWIVSFLLALLALTVPSCAQPLPDVADASDGTSQGDPTGTTEASDTAGLVSTTVDETGIEPGCGNGIVEAGESCDDAGESATCDVNCTEVVCGDGLVNGAAGEECDGVGLAGGTCRDLGFDAGTLSCAMGCSYDTSGCSHVPAFPVLQLSFSPVKQFDFSWTAVDGADHYRLEERISPGDAFVQVGGDIVGESISLVMPLHFRWQASYQLRACNLAGCAVSTTVHVADSLADAVGYVKASNTDAGDGFGDSVALSGDGNTLAVGAYFEDGDSMAETDDSAFESGAVYVFVRDGKGTWLQQAYVKASNTAQDDDFGSKVALSSDGNTLAVASHNEDGNSTGIDGDQGNDDALESGAVYVFVRDGKGVWSQQAYVKASNTGSADHFGWSLALSGDGDTLSVGAPHEDSNAIGIGGDQINELSDAAGGAYVFVRDGMGTWSQQVYVKASNTESNDNFGYDVALSGDGSILAIAAPEEDSNATGVGGIQGNNSHSNSGAVYMFVRDGMGLWTQDAYVKASNTDSSDNFGIRLVLSTDGNTLAVGAHSEDSNATGIGGDQIDNSAATSGAVYVFARDMIGWSQQAYIKASNTGSNDYFGVSVALSADGDTLAVAADWEDSGAAGVGGDQTDNSTIESGAVYVFARDDAAVWSQRAYVKASNAASGDEFGDSVALSADGTTLAVGASWEDSSAVGIGGDQTDDSAPDAGAVYLY